MKNLSFLFLVSALALGVVACGNKDKDGGSSNRFSSDPYKVTTVNGYLDTNQPIALVGNTTYSISQNSYQIMAQAFQVAQQQGIQPVMVNGSQKFKARITGSLQTGYQQQGGYQQQSGYQQQGSQTLNVTQAVIYR
jgi:hypothetical protein